ncbi:hypothetical protein [Alicyclobacillus fastidiosus]|uniref:Uncharacterized protein n=1 Tax=Alicyclobacillus fastidiosus TaxID=392011 RepID=A0ABV5AL30_9BACL
MDLKTFEHYFALINEDPEKHKELAKELIQGFIQGVYGPWAVSNNIVSVVTEEHFRSFVADIMSATDISESEKLNKALELINQANKE